MRALVLTDEGPQLRADYPAPQPQTGGALVRIHLAGVCSTDLQLVAGYKGGYRGVLGHEFVGTVVEAPGAPEWVGRRVVGELNIGCGRCDLCRRGLGKHCRTRQSLGIIGRDGAFADYLTLPLANLHRVPDDLADEEAVFAEPLAAALEILEQVRVTPASRVFVVGDGRLGLLIAQVLALTGCDLTVLGRHPAKLQILRDLGVQQAMVPTPEQFEELCTRPADLVVEATGAPGGFAQALRLVRPMGTLVLKSTFAGVLPAFDASQLVVDEITVVGSRCGPFPPALNLLATGRVQVRPLIQARFPLDAAVAALKHAGHKGVLKVLIQP
ncbi:MAG: alcohol dehydrogenase [Chloroflexi bacterium]|nr:MAG: alcohol dehydrogenase [Chloroflexota bacterium]